MDLSAKLETPMDNDMSAVDALRASIEQEHRFGTSFNGYNKGAVQKYIKDLEGQYAAAMTELTTELEVLKAEKEALTADQEILRAKLTGCEKQLETLPKELEDTKKHLTEEKETAVAAVLRDKDESISALKADYEEKLFAAKAESDGKIDALKAESEAQISAIKAECDAALKQNEDEFVAEYRKLEKSLEERVAEARADEKGRMQNELDIKEGLVENLKTANARLTEENRKKQLELAETLRRMEEMQAALADGSNTMTALSDRLERLLGAKLDECRDLMSLWQKEFREAAEAESKVLGN